MRSWKQIIQSAALAATLLPATALADGGWIDAGATGWNQPGAGVPGAPGSNPEDMARCEAILRGIETGEDEAVQASGWTLYGAPVGDFGIRIVSGLGGVDADCRPLAFQDFIFVDGMFAGTISPDLMDSGWDGARAEIGVPSGDFVVARFERWDGSSVWVNYYIERGELPLLVAIPNVPEPTTAAPPESTELTPPTEVASLPPAPTPVPTPVTVGPPVVSLDGSDDRAAPNDRFKIEVEATSGVGVASVSWWITGSDDPDLTKVNERTCDGDPECKETWRIRTFDSGTMMLHAKAIDTKGVSSAEVTKELRVRTRDGRPTVVVVMSGDEVESGQRVNLELIAKDDEGVDKMSWTATGTTDPELTSNHEEVCDGDKECTRLWRVRPSATGSVTINAKATDKSGKVSDVVAEELVVRGANVKPTVELVLNKEEFEVGEQVRIELVGKDEEGITRMWWYASDTDDVALEEDHEEACGNDKECQRTWRVTPNDTGRIKIHAKAIDNRKAESEEVVRTIRIIR